MSIAAELPPGAVTRGRTLDDPHPDAAAGSGRRSRLDDLTPPALLVARPRIVVKGLAVSLPRSPGDGARATEIPDVATHRGSVPAVAPPLVGAVTGFTSGGSVRLTWLGRLMVGLVATVLGLTVFAGAAVVAARHGRPAPALPSSGPATVVVQPGETLWTIARRVAPARDPREVVTDLRRLNALPTAEIQAGQQLRIRGP
jgi:LysM domain